MFHFYEDTLQAEVALAATFAAFMNSLENLEDLQGTN